MLSSGCEPQASTPPCYHVEINRDGNGFKFLGVHGCTVAIADMGGLDSTAAWPRSDHTN